MSNSNANKPDGIVSILEAFDLLGKRLFPKRWSFHHAYAALPGRRDISRSDPQLYREAWHVLIALGQHARDGELPVVLEDASSAQFHIGEISMLYPLPELGKPGQVELVGGDLLPAMVDVTLFHDVLRRRYPRKKSAGRSLAHPKCFKAALDYWLANSGKPPPGQVREQILLANPGIEDSVPESTLYRYIESARKKARKID